MKDELENFKKKVIGENEYKQRYIRRNKGLTFDDLPPNGFALYILSCQNLECNMKTKYVFRALKNRSEEETSAMKKRWAGLDTLTAHFLEESVHRDALDYSYISDLEYYKSIYAVIQIIRLVDEKAAAQKIIDQAELLDRRAKARRYFFNKENKDALKSLRKFFN